MPTMNQGRALLQLAATTQHHIWRLRRPSRRIAEEHSRQSDLALLWTSVTPRVLASCRVIFVFGRDGVSGTVTLSEPPKQPFSVPE